MYGLRVTDVDGNSCMLTENNAVLVASGNLTMPAGLNEDDTYGTDVELPIGAYGSSTYPVGSITVLAFPTKIAFQATLATWGWSGGYYPVSWYADSTKTYYTKDSDTGVMTTWAAGNMTGGTINTWDGMRGVFPLAAWDYTVDITETDTIRIWAAMCHIVYDYSASTPLAVYTIGSSGVSEVNYAVYLRKN
jgi:hypothetical protein